MRDDELSMRPRVLLLLVVVLTAIAAVLAFEALRATQAPSGSTAPSTGSSDAAPGSAARFEISGYVAGLAPGLTKEIVVRFTNPNTVPIYLTDLLVGLAGDSTPPGCSSDANMILHQATGITETEPVTVPAGESVAVSTTPRAPSLTFRDLDVSQDECKGVSFELTFTGRAHA